MTAMTRPFACCLALALLLPAAVQATALDDYVALPDDAYTYSQHSGPAGLGYSHYVLRLTSQQWRSPFEVDQPVWQHWLTIVVPWSVSNDNALLIINGGDTNDAAPAHNPLTMEVGLALATGSVTAALTAVPNQPLVFADEPVAKVEDEIIAYSWDRFLNGGDPFWPAQLPMVKSAVRAMDAVQQFCASLWLNPVQVNTFVVGGGSKRGWTTWLTAAVDDRVRGIVPMVIDLLNMPPSFRHHFAAYGFWAPAVAEYEAKNIFRRFEEPRMADLQAIVDPYLYRDRYAELPKYLICSSGDDFFLPDSAQFYFHELPGVKHIRYLPNTDHSLGGAEDEIVAGLVPWYDTIRAAGTLPRFSWQVQPDGSIRIETVDTPQAVYLWQASNPAARDFRRTTIGAAWTQTTLGPAGPGVYIAGVTPPATGWTAFFAEVHFPGSYIFSTEVSVVPDTLPYIHDFDYSGSIDLPDLAHLAARWLRGDCQVLNHDCEGADLDGSGHIDLADWNAFVPHWP